MSALKTDIIGYQANTGVAPYDAVHFSGEPITGPACCPTSGIQVLRHTGVKLPGAVSATMSGWATLANYQPEIDALLVNLKSSGRYRGRCGEHEFAKLLHRNHITFVPGTHRTELEFPASHSVLVMFVPAIYMRRVLADIGATAITPMHNERHDRLAQLIFMLESEIRFPGFASDLMIDGLLRAITTILVRHDGGKPTANIDRIHLSPARLAKVIELVEKRLDSEICLSDMARVAELSPFHFSRVFKLATGETPYQFVGSRRLDRARRMLTEGSMPLAELALCCGFASQSHFTAAFTKAMGMPPGRYRRNATN